MWGERREADRSLRCFCQCSLCSDSSPRPTEGRSPPCCSSPGPCSDCEFRLRPSPSIPSLNASPLRCAVSPDTFRTGFTPRSTGRTSSESDSRRHSCSPRQSFSVFCQQFQSISLISFLFSCTLLYQCHLRRHLPPGSLPRWGWLVGSCPLWNDPRRCRALVPHLCPAQRQSRFLKTLLPVRLDADPSSRSGLGRSPEPTTVSATAALSTPLGSTRSRGRSRPRRRTSSDGSVLLRTPSSFRSPHD